MVGYRTSGNSICYSHVPKTGGSNAFQVLRKASPNVSFNTYGHHHRGCIENDYDHRLLLLRHPFVRFRTAFAHLMETLHSNSCQYHWRMCRCCGWRTEKYGEARFIRAYDIAANCRRSGMWSENCTNSLLSSWNAHNVFARSVLTKRTLNLCNHGFPQLYQDCIKSCEQDLWKYSVIGFTEELQMFVNDSIAILNRPKVSAKKNVPTESAVEGLLKPLENCWMTRSRSSSPRKCWNNRVMRLQQYPVPDSLVNGFEQQNQLDNLLWALAKSISNRKR